jgi:pheromone a factor receptor
VVLLVRLYRYRSQFSRLINAQNTTRSRFLRLFFLAFILIVGTLPLNLYILYDNTRALHGEPYDWNRVHEHTGDMILSVPSNGHVRYEAWVRIAAGFLIFFHLGTGTDAGGIYRGWMEKLGLGKVLQAWGASTASVKTSWFSLSSKTKSAFKSKGSQTTSSTATVTSDPHRSTVSKTSTTASMLKQPALPERPTFKKPSFFSRLFQYAAPRPNILPVSVLDTADSSNIYFVKSAKAERAASANQWTKAEQAALYSRPRLDTAHVSGSTATAWSTERSPSTAEGMKDDVVVVRHEVVVENEKKEDKIHVEKQDLYGRLVSK